MTNHTNPMIEKVARAIYEKAIDTPATDPWPEAIARGIRYGGAMPPMVRQAYASAHAAIEAMRVPTPWMCGYVERISLSCGYGHEAEDFELIWRYMAEAALAEGDGE